MDQRNHGKVVGITVGRSILKIHGSHRLSRFMEEADVLTKGSFSQERWIQLTQLFDFLIHISTAMISCPSVQQRCQMSKSQQAKAYSLENAVRQYSLANTMRQEDCDNDLTSDTAWENLLQSTSSQQRNTGQSSSSSSWKPRRVREGAETSAHNTGRLRVRLTPAPKFREDPSIEFQTPSNENKDLKDHIIQNM